MVTFAHRRMRDHRGVVVLWVAVVGLLLSACGSSASGSTGGTQPTGRHLNVVAAENFWGSIAGQLGGSQVTVTSIVTDPNADPHDYESDTGDARAFATADYVILNGVGYDDWASKLLSGNPNSKRKILTVANLFGKTEAAGDNPHLWYNPDYVVATANRITSDLQSIDSADKAYFTGQRALFTNALKPYQNRIAAIKAKFPGQKVGATESIFVYMANALGLDLISPPEFMKAVAEGNDPPADTVATFQQQIQTKELTVLVYNVQTSTDVTNTLKQMAAQQGIPVVPVSETLQPPDATFQDWQLGQLNELQNALNADQLVK